MRFDLFVDVMRIEVPRASPFEMSDHHPLVAGRLSDGRQSYIFDLCQENDLAFVGSGPTPEEACFFQRKANGNVVLNGLSATDRLYLYVLRYDLGAYMHCEYYGNKMQTGIARMDSTGPFSWTFTRYLPAFQHSLTINAEADAGGEGQYADSEGLYPDDAEDEEMSVYDYQAKYVNSEGRCLKDL